MNKVGRVTFSGIRHNHAPSYPGFGNAPYGIPDATSLNAKNAATSTLIPENTQ